MIIHHDLKMTKVCGQWVQHRHIIAQKQKDVEAYQQLVQLYSVDLATTSERQVTISE